VRRGRVAAMVAVVAVAAYAGVTLGAWGSGPSVND